MRPLLESMPHPREHRVGQVRGIGHAKVSSMNLTGRVCSRNSSDLTSRVLHGPPRDDTRGGEGGCGERDDRKWHVDVPLRFRGGLTRGGLDVTLELVRVNGGGELPAGTPRRDGAWGGPSAGVGTAGAVAAVVDVVETAMVFACVDALRLDGKISAAFAAVGAARLGALHSQRRRRDRLETGGSGERVGAGGAGRASDSNRTMAGFFFDENPEGGAALAARLCSGALALRASGAALALIHPELRRTLRSAASLAGVRVAFARPAGGRGGDSAGADRGDKADVWHRRYRWAALRLAGHVPRTPVAPVLGPALKFAAGVAIAATTVGEGGEVIDLGPTAAGGAVPSGEGLRAGRRRRLRVDWSPRGGAGRRRRATRTEGVDDGGDTRVAPISLDQITAEDILSPPLGALGPPPAPPGPPGPPSVSEASSAPSSARSSPRKPPRLGFGGGAAPPGSPPATPERSTREISPADDVSIASSSSSADLAADPSSTRAGDIWRDERYAAARAGSIELTLRAWYLAFAFIPVFVWTVPLLVLSESAVYVRLSLLFSRAMFAASEDAAAECRAGMRRRAWKALHISVSMCGAALVKWAQWASVRRDIFPEDFCEVLSALHDDAPRHSKRQTARLVRKELGAPIEAVFSHFPDEPVASGSIAQVYRCVLRPEVARACASHDPELARRLRNQSKDLTMAGAQAHGLARAGGSSSRRPAGFLARWFGFGGSERERGENVDALAPAAGRPEDEPCVVAVKVRHPEVDRQIFLDFQILKRAVRLVSHVPALRDLNLEETLGQFSHTMTAQTDLRTEARNLRRFGRNFSRERCINAPWPLPGLVTEGLLCETFEKGESVSSVIRRECEHNDTLCSYGVDCYFKMLLRDNFLHSDLHPGNILYQDHVLRTVPKIESEVRLVLLDFGIADELPVDVRNEFLTFLFCLVHKDGIAAANAILRWSSAQTCVGAAADALRADMTALVDSMCDLRTMRVDIDAVLKAVMVLLRQHKVAIDPVYATLVVSLCVCVGFANSLDKDLNLFEVAVSAFVSYATVGEVVSGKLYA